MSHPTDQHCDTCYCDTGLFLARVPTDYEIFAVGTTEEQAKERALSAAMEWLNSVDVQYKDHAEIEEWLGCNVYPLGAHGIGQEG